MDSAFLQKSSRHKGLPLLAPGPLVLQSLCLDDMGPWPWLLQNRHLQRAPRRQLHGAGLQLLPYNFFAGA